MKKFCHFAITFLLALVSAAIEMRASNMAGEPAMSVIERAVALAIFIGSAGVTALLTALLIRYELGVPPAVLRLNALISAGAICFVLVVAIVGGADETEE